MSEKRRRTLLPPLDRRFTRIRVLAWSYPEAVDSGPGERLASRLTAGHPNREGYLWHRGSYKDLELALDRLRQVDRQLYRRFWRCYVGQWSPFPAEDEDWSGLTRIDSLMPSFLYVPADISVALGYLPGDADDYERTFVEAAA